LKKISVAGKAPENINGEELIQNLSKINVIPEESLDKFKASILQRIRNILAGEKSIIHIDSYEYNTL